MFPTRKNFEKMRTVLAMESINGGPTQEIEYTFYGRLANPEQLEQARERFVHEQWQINFEEKDNGVKSRIREIDGRRWVFTTKKTVPGVLGVEEEECDITQGMFATLRLVAVNGYKKVRYNFPILGTDRKWEVDVFLNSQGENSLWVKIDLEVSSASDPIPKLPLDFTDLIVHQGDDITAEEDRFIGYLWNEEWAKLDNV